MRCNVAQAVAALALFFSARVQAGELTELHVGAHTLQIEIAATAAARQRGLMGRTHLPADHGMLFVFEVAGKPCFWMRDTPLPLSIAFIDASGRVTDLADMQPRTDTLHCPQVDVRYALEIAQGSFLRASLAPGAQVQGLPR